MNMDVYSLEEDDDFGGMFLTHEPAVVVNDGILGDGTDFQSPCVSLIPQKERHEPMYEDISDDDFMDLPSSQMPPAVTQEHDR